MLSGSRGGLSCDSGIRTVWYVMSMFVLESDFANYVCSRKYVGHLQPMKQAGYDFKNMPHSYEK